MGLIRDIGQGPVALDSVAFIYFIAEHPRYLAVQLSAALSGGCTAMVTNDRRLPAVPGLRVLELREYARV